MKQQGFVRLVQTIGLFILILWSVFNLLVPATVLAADRKFNDDAGAAAQVKPAISMNKYGYGIMVWQDNRNGHDDVYGQIFTHRGGLFLKNFLINETNASLQQVIPDAAVNARGRSVVVWEERSDSVRVFAQLLAANGVKVGAKIRVDQAASYMVAMKPVVACDSLGNFVVCWIDNSGSTTGDIMAQRFSLSGHRLGNPIVVNTETNGPQGAPAVAMNDIGNFCVAWEDARELHTPAQLIAIYVQAFYSNGSRHGANMRVSAHAGGPLVPSDPCVAMDHANEFMVAWQQGHPARIYMNCYNANLQTRTKMRMVSDSLSNHENIEPDIACFSKDQYIIAWAKKISTQNDIYLKAVTNDGVFLSSPETRFSDETGEQRVPSVAVGETGVVAVFQDNRSGNNDIYANWDGVRRPLHPYAASGFEGIIPITWDHPYGNDPVSKYGIGRATSAGGPWATVATVDLAARGALGLSMRDWIDTDVINGVTYHYQIAGIAAGMDRASIICSAQTGSGFDMKSKWATTPPVIDGQINAAEWGDANAFHMNNPYTLTPPVFYMQNDDHYLYLAVDDPNDTVVDPANLFALIFDKDNNKTWPAAGPSGEGLLAMNSSGALFTGYWGTYPDHLGGDAPKAPAGVKVKITNSSGHVQYEISFDLGAGPITVAPGSSINMAFWVNDPGQMYPTHYGNVGEWPVGALWECARTLGTVQLASSAPAAADYDWPMVGRDPGRNSWSKDETVLTPPFADAGELHGMVGNVEDMVFSKNVLYFSSGTTDHSIGSNALNAMDYPSATKKWSFVFPGSAGSNTFIPAVGDSLILASSQGCSTLYALGAVGGQPKWSRNLNFNLAGCYPSVDGQRVFIEADSLYCLDLYTGARIWAHGYPQDYTYAKHVVDQTSVYYANGEALYCHDKATGALRWQVENSGLACLLVDESAVYGNHNNALVGRRKTDGAVLWTRTVTPGTRSDYENVLAATNSNLYFVQRNYNNRRQTLWALNKSTGAPLWTSPYDSVTITNPVIANGIVYLASYNERKGVPYAQRHWVIGLDLLTGAERFRAQTTTNLDQPIIAQHTLFVPGNARIFYFDNSPATTVQENNTALPVTSQLQQNYPNPFNSRTAISFSLAASGPVTIGIYNNLGQLVTTLLHKSVAQAGEQVVYWDGCDRFGKAAPSSVYFCRMQTAERIETRKLLLMR